MDTVRMKGRTIEDAKKAALEVLKLKEDEVEVRVISEGKQAMLGMFGGEEAEVEVFKRGQSDEFCRLFLQEILNKMGELAIVYAAGNIDGAVHLEIKGDDLDLGRVIGKDGAGLDALQQVVSAAASKRFQRRVFVQVDSAGYKKKKQAKLEDMAQMISQDVEKSNNEKILEPMSAADRRIIHMALKNSKTVHTYSIGAGRDRSIVIAPGPAKA